MNGAASFSRLTSLCGGQLGSVRYQNEKLHQMWHNNGSKLPRKNEIALKVLRFAPRTKRARPTVPLRTVASVQRQDIVPPSKTRSRKTQQQSLEGVWSVFVSRLAKAAALFTIASGVAFWATTLPAEAARSGGRMGGSAFASRSNFGGSAGFGTSMSPGNPLSGSTLGGSYSGWGRPLKSSTTHLTAPYRSSVTKNSFFFSPWGLGYGYGYPMGGGGGLGSILFWAVLAIIMVQVAQNVLSQGGSSGELETGERISVAKLQVGLLSTARDLQRDLERIASSADTSSPRGLHYVLQETVLALMRNPNYCVYGFAKSGVERSADEAESRFNKLSLEERGKFEKETRINVSGRTSRGSLGRMRDYGAPVSELIVVTILVAADGRVRLPKVNSKESLIESLATLGAVPASDILAVEVLWTPEEEDDYFTADDLAADYPLLNTL